MGGQGRDQQKIKKNLQESFKEYYQAKKWFGSMQTTNHGFESGANLNKVKNEKMDIMKRSHDSDQINAMANMTKLMVELCVQLEVAKAEQGAQIPELNTKIDQLTKMVEKLATPTLTKPPTTRRIGHCTKCEKRHEIEMCWED